MAGVAVSGTLVGAVLETAGYLAQEQILRDFSRFFQSVGVLFYVMAAIGAVISVALFGSYRMPRYLLVGPLLFYFLTGVTVETGGVGWQLGGGSPRTPEKFVQTVEQSSASITKLAARTVEVTPKNIRDDNTIQVSWVFRTFTRLISRVENSLNDLILQHENDKDLLFIARTRALESLSDPTLSNGQLLEMFKGDLLLNCSDMFAVSQRLASPALGFRRISELERKFFTRYNAIQQASIDPKTNKFIDNLWRESLKKDEEYLSTIDMINRLYERRATLRELYKEYSMERLRPSPTALRFMERTQFIDGSATQKWLASKGKNRLSEVGEQSMTCGEMWSVLGDAIEEEAARFISDWEKRFSPQTPTAQKRDILCKSISEKIGRATHRDEVEICDLVEVAAIFVLRNVVKNSARSDLAQRFQNRMQFMKEVKRNEPVLLHPGDKDPDEWELVGGEINFETRRNSAGGWEAKFRKKDGSEDDQWLRIAGASPLSNEKTAAYGDHQRLQTRELKQKVFTLSLWIPHLQGLLLYFLSILYPFLAVLVVLPGRAGAFLNFFLFWMWVKSWSVAFSSVIVLEQVLWNLFPIVDFDDYSTENAPLSNQGLSSVLSDALSIDPTFNAHAYYYFLAMALTAIPVITGFIFLKGRTAIISAFSDGVGEQAEGAAKRMEGAYGIGQNNRRMQAIAEYDRLAILSQGQRGIGMFGNNRGRAAAVLGNMATIGQTVAEQRRVTNAVALVNAPRAAEIDTVPKRVANERKYLEAFLYSDVAQVRTFDRYLGRFGRYQMRADADAAALDGDGGFEINDNIWQDFVDQRAALFTEMILGISNFRTNQKIGSSNFDRFIQSSATTLNQLVRIGSISEAFKQFNSGVRLSGIDLGQKTVIAANQISDAASAGNKDLGLTEDEMNKAFFNDPLNRIGQGGTVWPGKYGISYPSERVPPFSKYPNLQNESVPSDVRPEKEEKR